MNNNTGILYELVYVSTAIRLFKEQQLKDLLVEARERNQALSVTGMLLYKNQSFLQLLEGCKENVLKLYESIGRDKRHFRVKTLHEGYSQQRKFENWAMGFQRLDDSDSSNLPGFTRFLHRDYDVDEISQMSGQAIELLLHFRKFS